MLKKSHGLEDLDLLALTSEGSSLLLLIFDAA